VPVAFLSLAKFLNTTDKHRRMTVNIPKCLTSNSANTKHKFFEMKGPVKFANTLYVVHVSEKPNNETKKWKFVGAFTSR
jgi:hypothetical protein